MKQKKKNKFYTFILSFMPGAAEMYMGFMKKGVSLMGIFFLCIVIPIVLRLDVLVFVAVLVWCYSFFHARNLAASDDMIFEELKDDYIWASFVNERDIQFSNPTLRRWGAWIMIVFGVVMLWQNFSSILYRLIPDSLWEILAPIVQQVPEVTIALLLIYAGIHMIKGKKEELDGDSK